MTDDYRQPGTVILVTGEGMGDTDNIQLRHNLAKKYFHLLGESEMLPGAICFYTNGVRLVTEGSPVLDELKVLQEKGVYLVICGTCLNTLGLADKVKLGIVGGMTDIIDAQWRAEKVVTL
jgi:intracellular sulfur oxidation DsrE/DsrF family protein